MKRYGQFEYKPGMGEVSLLGPILLLIFVVGTGAALYYWKKYKAEQEEEEEEEEKPSKSIKTIDEAIEYETSEPAEPVEEEYEEVIEEA
jgi:hypothetical protein